ncbi:MAG TPA: D-glycerate dehydrogenase [Candidatus Nanoarchaeia archaeon]|nr:D-glycerate dehydrogenase [Candidatus Nanoarchaeia archaeon]
MPKPKVFLTRHILDGNLSLLQKHCQLKIYPKDQPIPKKELLKEVKHCDALLCLLTDKIDKEVIDANPHLKIIANYAVGYDNIDLAYATKKSIPVANTPGKLISEAVAEHTVALLLALAKRLREADAFTRAGNYAGWSPTLLLGSGLKGKTLGIIGLGRIGSGVAERCAHGMGMQVLYYDVIRNLKFEKKYKAIFTPLRRLLLQSDFVTLHVPLLPSTRHLISSKELALMKKTAFLVNTSRGPVVDEKALVSALQRKQIAGAALDVFEHEPKLAPGLAKLDNILLTPHTASSTVEAREEMTMLAVRNILAALAGKKVPHVVNKGVYGGKK